jgi:hypothetical protein
MILVSRIHIETFFALDIRKKSYYRNIMIKTTHQDQCQFVESVINFEVVSYDFRWNL